MSAGKIACISVDLDPLDCYAEIHGLRDASLDAGAVPGRALERFGELFAAHGVHATFFFVGRAAEGAGDAARAGHEVGNHSFSHDYALSRRGYDEALADLKAADEALRAATGVPVRGFRAPGYNLSPELLRACAALGYAYDSSVLPSPPYYAARAAVIAGYRALGRRSGSIVGRARDWFSSRHPRAALPGLVELPLSVLPVARLHFIGTTALTAPRWMARAAYSTLRGDAFFNFELHGVDLLDASDAGRDGARLAAAQRDLRVPAAEKRARLDALLRAIRADFEVVTLAEAGARFAAGAAAP